MIRPKKTNMENENLSQVEPGGNTKTPGQPEPEPAKNIQLYRWCFTLKFSTDSTLSQRSQEIQLWTTLNNFCKKFQFQLEKGEETGYLHFQGVFSLNEKHRFGETINILGYPNIRLSPCRSWWGSWNYTKKEETHVSGPWNQDKKPINIDYKIDQKWQQDLIEIIKQEPDHRKIFWFYDEIGGKGKTNMAKYLVDNHDACYLNCGGAGDIAYFYDGQPVVVFDYPRTLEGRISYDSIESLKNGILFSKKYESKVKRFDKPHVIVFANFEPDEERLSKDRWVIVTL